MEKEKIAIIGTGIAGMGCAYFLQNKYDITLYEKNNYVGGHTNTISVDEDGKTINIDTGFMVFNETTYPNLIKLFKKLNVKWKNTDMSFSVQHRPSGLEYSGSGFNGLFSQRWNIFNPRHIKLLAQVNRFNKESVKILGNPKYSDYSMADYVKEMKFGEDFLYKYLAPMSSALWSTPTDITLTFPAVALVRFFLNHGFLGLNTQFQWLTVDNGSVMYRNLLIKSFENKILINNGVKKVIRDGNHVVVVNEKGIMTRYDKVIFASHADETLNMIENLTEEEKRLLSKFKYQKNIATLHTDTSVMPKLKRTWSSWNYIIDKAGYGMKPYTVYYMNKLQQVSDKKDYFVSINGAEKIDARKVLKRIEYDHPVFTVDVLKAQKELPSLNKKEGQLFFCGSYFKYGFHEDAFTSAIELCEKLIDGNIWDITAKNQVSEPAFS
jgi:uncharacterized protein